MIVEAQLTEPAAAVLRSLKATLAPEGRDRRLLDHQVLLTPETKALLYAGPPTLEHPYSPGSDPVLEEMVAAVTVDRRPGLATVVALNRAVSCLAQQPISAQDRSVLEILTSGAATVIERARVLAVTAQMRGIAARICLLYGDTGAAPAFHAVCELGIMGGWAVFDPLANQCYLVTHHPYASAWDLMRRPAIVDGHPEHGSKPTIDAALYRIIGISLSRAEA